MVPLDNVDRWLREMEAQGHLIDQKVYVGLYFIRHPEAAG